LASARHDLTLAAPIALREPQTWVLAAHRTVALARGLTGARHLTLAGDGHLDWSGNGPKDGGITARGGTIRCEEKSVTP
jgi:hypothetical protein